ncbi:MAG: TIGR04255 family protein, partial [Thermoanaerobaculia bacterium]|nr:TIGR04255 family protein [Thermoanaerobaculia bacterium]
ATPKGIEAVTLRYIDRILPPADGFHLGDWISENAFLPSRLMCASEDAFCQSGLTESGMTEVVAMRLQREQGGNPVIHLDTAISLASPVLAPDPLVSSLNDLHTRVVQIFQECISEKTKALLEPEPE